MRSSDHQKHQDHIPQHESVELKKFRYGTQKNIIIYSIYINWGPFRELQLSVLDLSFVKRSAQRGTEEVYSWEWCLIPSNTFNKFCFQVPSTKHPPSFGNYHPKKEISKQILTRMACKHVPLEAPPSLKIMKRCWVVCRENKGKLLDCYGFSTNHHLKRQDLRNKTCERTGWWAPKASIKSLRFCGGFSFDGGIRESLALTQRVSAE